MADVTSIFSDRDRWLDELSRNYGLYRERLIRGLCRTFRNYRLQQREAEDLADKALVKAVANIAQFDPAKRPFYVWLHMIAERCALDYVQSAERRRATVNTDDLDYRREPPAHPDPAEEFERKRQVVIVQAAVEALPKGQRDAIRLWQDGELSHEDAAAKMDVPVRRFRQWLYQGMGALGRKRELKVLHFGCDYSRKETRPEQSRNRGDAGVRG
jgi:RNA polymerase sigma factor (sigma-70 family)